MSNYQINAFYQVKDDAPCRQTEIYKVLEVMGQKITFLAIDKYRTYIAEFMIGSKLDSWLNKIPSTNELELKAAIAMELANLKIIPHLIKHYRKLCEYCNWNFTEIKRLDNICFNYYKTFTTNDLLFQSYLSTLPESQKIHALSNIEGFIHLYMENKEKENKLLKDEKEK